MTKISIEDFSVYEEHNPVNTPKSIKACALEGISPEDLLYIPLIHSKDKLVDLLNEREFKKRENKRLELIEAVRHRKRLLKAKQKSSREQYYMAKTIPLNEVDAGLSRDKDYHKVLRLGREVSEFHKKEIERELSARSREKLLRKIELAKKFEEKEKKKDRELRDQFQEKVISDMEAEKEKVRERQYYEEIKERMIKEKNRKAKAVHDLADKITETKLKRMEKKIKTFNEKAWNFENVTKREQMKDKAETMRTYRERCEKAQEKAYERGALKEKHIREHYQEATKREKRNLLKAIGNKLRCSDTFKDIVRERKRKSMKKPKKTFIKKQNKVFSEKVLQPIKEQIEEPIKEPIKEPIQVNIPKKKRKNIEKYKPSKLRVEIEEKNKKIKEFLAQRQQKIRQVKKQPVTDEKEIKVQKYVAIWNLWDVTTTTKESMNDISKNTKLNSTPIGTTRKKEVNETEKWRVSLSDPKLSTM